MREAFVLVDEYADGITSDLALVVDAIGGAYDREYRSDPTSRGLRAFLAATADASQVAASLARARLECYDSASRPFRNAALQETEDALRTRDVALQQLGNMIEHVRLTAARRFRAATVSRNSIARPTIGSLKVLNRAGQGVQAKHAFYLLARKILIDAFNEAQVEGLAALGENGVVITRDPGHPLSGKTVVIAHGKGDRYADIQDQWFHPRSSALVSRNLNVHP